MSSETTMPTLPSGYTYTTIDDNEGIWVSHEREEGVVDFMTFLTRSDTISNMLYQDSDDQLWKWKDWSGRALAHGPVFTPIPDAQLPDPVSDMSRNHIYFNSTTNKWELPDITDNIASVIENRHDNDVNSALQNYAQWSILETLVKAQYPERNNPQHRTGLRNFYDKWNETSEDDACILQADAWRKSLGKVEHPENTAQLAETALANAHMFCEATATQALRVKYINVLITRYEADADKAADASDRHYPRGVIFVKKLSRSPSNPKERTIKSVVANIRTSLTEG